MRIIHYFLIGLFLFLILILSLWILPIPDNAGGMAHPEYKTMLHSGANILATTTTRTVSFLFGLGVIMLFYFFIRFGANRKKDSGKLSLWINISFVAYLIVYAMTFLSYLNYESTGHDTFFFGWPTPTAWMIYGMWSTPIILVLVYVIKFKDWVLDDEDEEEFQKILQRRKERLAN